MRRFDLTRAFRCSSFPKAVTQNVRLYSSSASPPKRNMMKLTLVSASVGALVGVGYSGYAHFAVNNKNKPLLHEPTTLLVMKEPPRVDPTRRVLKPNDTSDLKLVLFQYQTCPFCCKVRAFLDYYGISYDIVEVDAVLRQSIKWSPYKKVPILLAKTENGYQQLNDSSVIVSVLSSYLTNDKEDIAALMKYYPSMKFVDDSGNVKEETVNKYYVMRPNETATEKTNALESDERKWRQWGDSTLVHMLSPNVYRSLDESFQAFNWFSEVGLWKEHFPNWEVKVMVNVGAVAMYLIGKRLKRRHNLKDDVRQSLYDECNHWAKRVAEKKTPFMGGENPNLSDLSTYGILNSIEGCDAFADLKTNSKIGEWYDRMKEHVVSGKGAGTFA